MTGFQILTSTLALAGMLLFGGVWAFQTYGIYRFDQTPQSPEAYGLSGVRVLTFISEDGAPVQAWLSLPASGRPVLFSFYGNFAALDPVIPPFLIGCTRRIHAAIFSFWA